jgi:hypothetical protein
LADGLQTRERSADKTHLDADDGISEAMRHATHRHLPYHRSARGEALAERAERPLRRT